MRPNHESREIGNDANRGKMETSQTSLLIDFNNASEINNVTNLNNQTGDIITIETELIPEVNKTNNL